MNTSRRSKTKRGILVAIVLVALIALIGGTYARYSSGAKVTAQTEVANWHVVLTKLNGEDDGTDISAATAETVNKTITFQVQDNAYVVAGKMAPDVTATASLELDLAGTEVAVDFDAVIDDSALEAAFGKSADKVQLTTTVDGTKYATGTAQHIDLPSGAAFTSENGKKTVLLTLKWTNDDANNPDDTDTGINKSGAKISIPVTLTVKQHIASDPAHN